MFTFKRPMKLEFDPVADAMYFEISNKEIADTKEIEPGIMGDYDADGRLVGIEVLAVSKRDLSGAETKAA